MIEHILLIAALLLLFSILASKAAVRFGVPTLLLFLLVGMLAGADGPGGIYFDDPRLTQSIGVIALAFILFSGGLDTDAKAIRPILRQGLSLATVGVVITAVAVGQFADLVLGFTLLEGLLLGAIISSTDAAAVFSILRGRAIKLKGNLRPLLEFESGSNDPIAVLLTIGLIRLLTEPATTALDLVTLFVLQAALGVALGWLFGRLATWAINRLQLEFDGLYPVFTVTVVLLTYGLTATLGGSGFLAVYITGLILGNSEFVHRQSLRRFHDGLAWIMQIVMFLTLGLQVFPSQFASIFDSGVLLTIFLIVIARPLSVFLALLPFRETIGDKLFVAWVGLRGAAPIVLATFPLLAGVEPANTIFNLVFFVVCASVMVQGPLIAPVARLLGVHDPYAVEVSPLRTLLTDEQFGDNLVELVISENSPAVGKQILELRLPDDVLFLLIGRDKDVIIPKGSVQLQAGDRVLIAASEEKRWYINAIISPALSK
jgi:potassium/hydrogen antiporter